MRWDITITIILAIILAIRRCSAVYLYLYMHQMTLSAHTIVSSAS